MRVRGMTTERARLEIIGRDAELKELHHRMDSAMGGAGSAVLVSGEPGIGKTRLVEEFKKYAVKKNARMLAGGASSESMHPFLVFSKALEGISQEPLFEEQEFTSFTEIFAVNGAGLLLAKASSEAEAMDADIFAGMLSAVQDFVRDSFDQTGEKRAGLGRLEYGDMTVFIEHGQHIFLTAVFRGTEHPDMKNLLRQSLHKLEQKHGAMLGKWSGKVSEMEPVSEEINALAGVKFLVRRNLEGVKLASERLRIADKLLGLLLDLSEEKPVLLLLEDLHWADDSSLFVLNYLARNLKGKPAMLLATCRPGESQSLQKTIDAMKKEDVISEMALKKLGKESVTGIINSVYPGNDFPSEFVDALAERCGGTPLFVLELLKQMGSDGSISQTEGRYSLVNQNYTIPNTIEEVIQNRLAGLDSNALSMAEFASCIGREFSIDSATAIKTIADPSIALAELQRSGVVYRHNGSAEFSHAMYQELIYSSIAPRWKSAHHKAIGEYFEGAYQGKLDEVCYELARHFSQTNEYGKAFDYCVKAGEKAEGAYALEQASQFYKNALNTVPKLRRETEKPGFELDLTMRIGDLQELLGDLEHAVKSFQSAFELAREPEIKARMLRKIGNVLMTRGESEKAISEFNKALAILEKETSPEKARVLSELGWVYERTGEYEKDLSLQTEAAKLLSQFEGVENDLGRVYNKIGTCYWVMGNFPLALEHMEKGLEIAEKMKDEKGIASFLNNIGITYMRTGQFGKANEKLKRALELFTKLGVLFGIGSSSGNVGNVHMARGEFDKALQYYKKCMGTFEKIGDRYAIGAALGNIGLVYQTIDEYEHAMDYYEKSLAMREALADKRGVGQTMAYIGNLMYLKKDYDNALAYLQSVIKIGEELNDDLIYIFTHNIIALIKIEKGQIDEAEEINNRMLDKSREKNLREYEAQTLNTRGVIEAKKGNWQIAEDSFKDSIAILKINNINNLIPNVYMDYGAMLKSAGKTSEARAIFQDAKKMYEEMSLNKKASEARAELARLDHGQ